MRLEERLNCENVGDQPLRAPRRHGCRIACPNVIRQVLGAIGQQCTVQQPASQPAGHQRPCATCTRCILSLGGFHHLLLLLLVSPPPPPPPPWLPSCPPLGPTAQLLYFCLYLHISLSLPLSLSLPVFACVFVCVSLCVSVSVSLSLSVFLFVSLCLCVCLSFSLCLCIFV